MPEIWTMAGNLGFTKMRNDSKNTGGEINLRLRANYAEQDLFADIKLIFICNKKAAEKDKVGEIKCLLCCTAEKEEIVEKKAAVAVAAVAA